MKARQPKKTKKNKKSLIVVIISVMMLCLISSNLIIALSSSLITKQELTKAAYSTIYGMIDAVAVDVNAKNETYFSALDTLSYVPYFRDSSHTLREKTDWLNSIAENDTLFKNIMFIDKNGEAYRHMMKMGRFEMIHRLHILCRQKRESEVFKILQNMVISY